MILAKVPNLDSQYSLNQHAGLVSEFMQFRVLGSSGALKKVSGLDFFGSFFGDGKKNVLPLKTQIKSSE